MTRTERDAKRWQALMEHCDVNYVDARDMEPIFEVKVPCDWRLTDFKKAIDAVVKESE